MVAREDRVACKRDDPTGYSPHVEEKGIVSIYHVSNPSKNLNGARRRSCRGALGGRSGHAVAGSGRQARRRHKGMRGCTKQAPQEDGRQETFHWIQLALYRKMKPEMRKAEMVCYVVPVAMNLDCCCLLVFESSK